MLIFDQEKLDGLESLMSDKLSFEGQARIRGKTDIETEIMKKVQASANPDQPDLFYLDSILVSIGWNKNDDIFDKDETWGARNTPVDKQFNFMHDEKDIIGHITSANVIDENNDVYSGDEPPEKFHIQVQSVLYKHWSDESLQERMDKLVAEIKEDKWFVSMECLFPTFDYGVLTPDGEKKVIARTSDTAFLTKHLRAYGGTGEYKGHKIGRLLRNLVFSGKGLVDQPANPSSIIFNSVESFNGTKASINILGNNMTIELEALSKQLEEVKAEKLALVTKLAESNFEATVATLNKDNESLKTTVAELQKVIDDLKKTSDEKDTLITQANDNTKKVREELDTAKAEINQAKADKVTSDRVTKLVGSGVEEAEASVIAAKFVQTSDEIFEEVAKAYAKKGTVKEVVEPDLTDKDLEKTEAAVISTEDTDQKLEKTRASITTFLVESLKKGAK